MVSRITFACVLIFSTVVSASVLKDALEEHIKDTAHKEGAEAIKQDNKKAQKIHEIDSDIKDINKNQFSKANDEASYTTKEHDLKAASESDAYKGYNAKQDKAEDSESAGFKQGHKKGHHKQGFQNSYHKDESSNKSTFFDDLTDEGDRAAYNSRLNSHEDQGGRSYQGSHNTGKEHLRDNHQVGGYNRQGDYGNQHRIHQDHGKHNLLDDHSDYNKYQNGYDRYDRNKVHDRSQYHHPQPQPLPPPHPHHIPHIPDDRGWGWDDRRNGWDEGRGWERDPGWQPAPAPAWRPDPGWAPERGWQGESGWSSVDPGWDRTHPGPGYFDGHGHPHQGGYGHAYGYGESRADPVAEVPRNAPVVAHRKQTITIYEDPRYNGADKGSLRREEGDSLQLEFKPSGQRYAEYDDQYYASSPRRGAESSNINKLVYNYRRQ